MAEISYGHLPLLSIYRLGDNPADHVKCRAARLRCSYDIRSVSPSTFEALLRIFLDVNDVNDVHA